MMHGLQTMVNTADIEDKFESHKTKQQTNLTLTEQFYCHSSRAQ